MARPFPTIHRPQQRNPSLRSSLPALPFSPSDAIPGTPPHRSSAISPPGPRRISTMSPPSMQNQSNSYFPQQPHSNAQHQQYPPSPQIPGAVSHFPRRQPSYAPQSPSTPQHQAYLQQKPLPQQPLPPQRAATHMSSTNFNYFDYPIVIAIDFGTTYSGCSYAFAQNETEIHDITKWPKQNNNVYPKTPTLLYYKKGPKKITLTEWGNGARLTMLKPTAKDGTLLHQFKLYLEDDFEKLRLPPLAEGITVLDAIVDYLKAMHHHIMAELRKGFANNYGPHQFRYCLTVPAIWSDRAKSTMREAAVRAGIVNRDDHPERLMLISEPEAAALYCEKKCDQWNLRHGDKFMICDAGGGTVDLIVYEIEDMPSGRTLKEVTSGHGGACGSVFLDNNMHRLLAHRLKAYMQHIPACAFESMMEKFVETVKPDFEGNEDQYISLPASTLLEQHQLTNEAMDLEEGVLRFSAAELKKEVFDPVIMQVLDLIEQQISQVNGRLDAIFLVGGFGSSNYLYECVRAQFGRRVGKIAAPPRGELAVVRGAVYFGLNPRVVTSKISRRSYGVMTRMTFEEGKDPEESAVVTSEGVKRCSTRFDVYIKKGQRIGVDFRISKGFWITYPKNTEADLYAYDGDPPIPRQVTDPGVTKIADFPIEIPPLPGVKIGDRVDLRIDFIFSLTELRIEAVVNNNQRFVFTSKFEATDVYGA